MLLLHHSSRGCVYGMDIQEDALRSSLTCCNNPTPPRRMEEVIPTNASVRLVAFNLGCLPGGDKSIITKAGTNSLSSGGCRETCGIGRAYQCPGICRTSWREVMYYSGLSLSGAPANGDS
ncbi:hypothetical protein MLD38_012601 [Melastoma candidum]|uniref:Uncharacterized protein n=1 Tax=Melastoma candidum TaxID=119954 RepID=A0ACB9R851_9MYRT|nr:hypothetical protein MLD38_012601 [Melastoma candidum]